MAPRIPVANGVHQNGDLPPPSTLAAQIVQNQTTGAPSQQNGDTPTFAALLHEILHNHAATPETDVDTNVKLVNVVAEAGLGPLAVDDPFAQWDVLTPQAIDSIAVIQATIQKHPGVLFAHTQPDGPQLLLPLLVRLLAVCGKAKCEGLPVGRLLDSVLHALDSSRDLWRNAKDVREIVQDCVSDAISSLEASFDSKLQYSVKLPPARSIAKFWPASEYSIALPHECQTTLTHQSHSCQLVLELCQVSRLSAPWREEVQYAIQKMIPSIRSHLEGTRQWENVVKALLSLPNPLTTVMYMLYEMPKSFPSSDVQTRLSYSLIDLLRNRTNAFHDHALPLLQDLAASESFDNLNEDLRIAITTTISRFCPQSQHPQRVQRLSDALRDDNVMLDSAFQASFRELSVSQSRDCSSPPRRKRRRFDGHERENLHLTLTRQMTKLLTGTETDALSDAVDMAPNAYSRLNIEQQCAAWTALSDLAEADPMISTKIVKSLLKGLPSPPAGRVRVLSMLAMRACAQRLTESSEIDLARSQFGQMCLLGLHSSLRELRIAASQCLPVFLRDDLASDLRTTNRQSALKYLRVLSDRDAAAIQETLVASWSQLANVCEDSELNLCLLQLVDYLGHPNPMISGLAFTELERIADARGVLPLTLFKPFWSSLAVSVVQDLHSRPQKVQQLCDLLEMDVNQWLVLTKPETIPTLVLTRKREILQRIADAHNHSTSVQDLLLQPRTSLMAILALLLAQSGSDPEDAAMACLTYVAPKLQETNVPELIQIDPTLLACNMLQYISEQAENRKSRAYQTFQYFTMLAQRRPGQAKAKHSRALGDFFDSHILGIMTHFSNIIENTTGMHTKPERLRCIGAIAEMIILAKEKVSGALTQIRAALQSSMEHVEMCEASFAAWLQLLPVLESDDIAQILDQTFALILRHWSRLSEEVRQACHDRVSSLVKIHNQILLENIMTLPSLTGIALLAKVSAEIERFKAAEGVEAHCRAFTKRLGDESRVVVLRALEELPAFLTDNQESVHDSASSVQPTPVLSELLRALLDASIKHAADNDAAAELVGKALGVIGCLDPNRVEITRKKGRVLVLANFDRASEVEDWTLELLEDILVKAFKSVNDAKAQGFLAFVIQELLRFCEFNDGSVLRPRASQVPSKQQKWSRLPENVRITLTPFVKSRYVVTNSGVVPVPHRAYPGFQQEASHSSWLRSLVFDLMWKAKGENAKTIFPVLAKTIRGHDLAIANFMLPYTVLNVVLGGTVAEVNGISDELLAVLRSEPVNGPQWETVKLCSESVFNVLDYMSLWLQEKKKVLGEMRAAAYRTGHSPSGFDEATDMAQIDIVERFLRVIPADLVANRAILCKSYSRALFNWEQHIRRKRPLIPSTRPAQSSSSHDRMLYDKLLDIYAQIDEPDGLEGISAHLSFLSEEQQAMQHAKAGRWTAAQAWYELQLAEDPQNVDLEERLLGCFRETGRYEPLLKYADSFLSAKINGDDVDAAVQRLAPSIVEAQWMLGDLPGLKNCLDSLALPAQTDFNLGIADILDAIVQKDRQGVDEKIKQLRTHVTQSMTFASTNSIQGSHDDLRKLHVLHEIESFCSDDPNSIANFSTTLDKRLSVMGSYVLDKQYVLGIRRAVMQSLDAFGDVEIGPSWLLTAKLARQAGNNEQAYGAVLKAYECGDNSAKIEEARLLWRGGHQRHAIQGLQTAITSGIFENMDTEDTRMSVTEGSVTTRSTSTTTSMTRGSEFASKQSVVSAKVHLLLAKWLDASGQTQTNQMTERFQTAAKKFQRWEKGHYYLGKHYQKLLDAEKGLPKERQSLQYHSGELTKLVAENLIRSLPFGNKYWHETIPKILTLWLELGSNTITKPRHEDQAVFDRRVKALQGCSGQLLKYIERIPAYVFYSAVPQMISRITHGNPQVWKMLANILTRIASSYPHQVLWSLLAIVKSSDRLRVERGTEILNRLKDPKTKAKSNDGTSVDLRMMITHGQKLSDGLLRVCEVPIEKSGSEVRLSEDLGFNHKLAPSQLVVPIETTLTVGLSNGANQDSIKRYRAFVQDRVTIHSFAEEVLVLNSLQRPRKLTVRGSDGKQYGLLCKPKDDLRKDRRLMEFNGIINRTLKRDAESSKRRLYVKTYAVTPLSEESGIIEWVEGIKPMRDILLQNYGRKGIRPNYGELKTALDQACAAPDRAHLFEDNVLSKFPPVLHEWFVEVHAEPDAWFAARLRYARSAAVMSMAGHVLGLGDRHGENILLEESTGGVFHVDFNCLFDKGLTFDKPELVPFRLTHNMVDAMGPYGYEGPFRKSSELTLRLLRQSKDTLMTVLETFLYDPTTDFIGQKKKRSTVGVPETPQDILDTVENKLKGLLKNERVPLGVEGYVDTLIREATSPFFLASMYIGWCAFL